MPKPPGKHPLPHGVEADALHNLARQLRSARVSGARIETRGPEGSLIPLLSGHLQEREADFSLYVTMAMFGKLQRLILGVP